MILRKSFLLWAALVWVAASPSAFAQTEAKDLPPGHKTVLAEGVPIVYTDQGEGDPLMIFTPYPFSTALWSDLARRLSTSMRVIVIEPPGLRTPDALKWDFSDIRLLEIYRELVRSLKLSQVHVLGVGESGAEAVAFAHHWPHLTKSVVSINGLESAKWSDEGVPVMIDALRGVGSKAEGMLFSLLSARWRDKAPGESERESLLVPLGDGTRTKAFQSRMDGWRDSLRSGTVPIMLPNLNKPLLSIRSKDDQFLTRDYIERTRRYAPAPLIQYEVVAGAGHFAFIDQPEKTAELIRSFTSKHSASKGF